MAADDGILKGVDLGPIPKCSLAEFILPRMKALPKDSIFQVDGETGATQTFHQNLTKSIQLSEGLRKLGLRESEVVVMACRNSFNADEIVLATWLAGATIAPINGYMKLAEAKHILGLFEPKFVFTEDLFAEIVTSALESLSSSATVILIDKKKSSRSFQLCLEDVRVDVDVDSYDPLPVTSPSTQLIGILASSGTTGLPKGVGITHTNFIFQALNLSNLKNFNQPRPFLSISGFFWVTGDLLYLTGLTSGHKRILIKEPSIENILRAIDKFKPKITMMGPALLSSITNSPEFDKYDVSSLECFLLGGSPFLPNFGEKLLEIWGREKIFNSYGTTEVSGCVLMNEDDEDAYALGRPTPGVQVKMVDTTTGETVKANTTGEICVKSPGLMWGYVKNEESTRETIDSEGWLHTGDLAYYDESGAVHLVDRIKEMIKIMNMQISPLEVENTIVSLPGVLEAGVIGVTHDGKDIKLKALVVKEKNSTVTEEDICAHVADVLSDYKRLTGGVQFVESLPRTPTGKLLRRELKQIAQANSTA